MLPLEKNIQYSTNIDCFVIDWACLYIYITFVAFCLLSVIRKQWLEQYNRRPISAYDRFPERLLSHQSLWSSVWNFSRRVADVPPRETSLIGDERGETSVFTGYWTSFKTPFSGKIYRNEWVKQNRRFTR